MAYLFSCMFRHPVEIIIRANIYWALICNMLDTFLRILSIVMWVPFHTNRNQPNGTRTLIIPCADGEVEAREIARSYCYEWQSWGLTCVVCLCHPKEVGALGSHLDPADSFLHWVTKLLWACVVGLMTLSSQICCWVVRCQAQKRPCSRLSPCVFACWFARLSPAWSVRVCVRLHMSLHRGRKWGSSTTAGLSQGCSNSRDPGSEVCSWWT